MQKKLIAIAIAAVLAPAAAMADTSNINLYGRLNVSVDSLSGVTNQSTSMYVNTNSSRFGVKGSEDLGDGWKAIFQVETNVNATGTGRGGNGNAMTTVGNFGAFGGQIRDTWLGLSTPMGTIQIGRQAMENHWVYDTNLFADQVGDLGTFNSMTGNGRANGEILYTSPNMSGFTMNVQAYPTSSVVPAATGSTVGSSASWGMELNYTVLDMVKLNFNYLNRNTGFDTEYKPLVLSAIWNFSSAGLVNAQYLRDKRNVTGQQAERTIWNIGGKYNIMPNGTLKAQYSRANDVTGDVVAGTTVNGLKVNQNSGANMFVFGFDYSLSKRTMVQLAYAKTKNDTNAAYGVQGAGYNAQAPNPVVQANPDNPRGLGVALTHNF
jgi:predicted porin